MLAHIGYAQYDFSLGFNLCTSKPRGPLCIFSMPILRLQNKISWGKYMHITPILFGP